MDYMKNFLGTQTNIAIYPGCHIQLEDFGIKLLLFFIFLLKTIKIKHGPKQSMAMQIWDFPMTSGDTMRGHWTDQALRKRRLASVSYTKGYPVTGQTKHSTFTMKDSTTTKSIGGVGVNDWRNKLNSPKAKSIFFFFFFLGTLFLRKLYLKNFTI